jgi:hypothetical protein
MVVVSETLNTNILMRGPEIMETAKCSWLCHFSESHQV